MLLGIEIVFSQKQNFMMEIPNWRVSGAKFD